MKVAGDRAEKIIARDLLLNPRGRVRLVIADFEISRGSEADCRDSYVRPPDVHGNHGFSAAISLPSVR